MALPIPDLACNLIAAVIYDPAKYFVGKLTDNLFWKKQKAKLQLSESQNDFLDRYAEACVEFFNEKNRKPLGYFFENRHTLDLFGGYLWNKIPPVDFQVKMTEQIHRFQWAAPLSAVAVQEEVAVFLKIFDGKVNDSLSAGDARRDRKLDAIAEKIERKPAAPPRALTEIPRFDAELVGRDEALKALRQALETSGSVTLLNGIGGVGKSTLAMELVRSMLPECDHVAWVRQLGDFATSLLANGTLLANLNFLPSGSPEADARMLLNRLGSLQGNCLLVIDNAEKDFPKYKDAMPPTWKVLVTSREDLGLGKPFLLDLLPLKDAVLMFKNYYARPADDAQAADVVLAVDRHTLAVEILAKTAGQRRIPLPELARLLAEMGLEIGKEANVATTHSQGEQVKRLSGYLTAIFQLGDVAENPDSVWLLHQFIALPPVPHPFPLLANLLLPDAVGTDPTERLSEGLENLRKQGWLTFSDVNETYQMHRVVQDVVARQLRPGLAEVEVLVGKVSGKLYIDQTKDNPVDKFGWLPFGEHLGKMVWVGKREEVSLLLDRLRWVLWEFGQYQAAAKYGERSLEIAESIFEKGHTTIAIRQSNLALVYRALGDHARARDLLEEALRNDLENFGEKHPNVARCQSNLANVYRDLGDHARARDLLEEALRNDLENFGEKHPNVAVFQSNLAIVYQALGDLARARDLLEEALRNDLENFGEKHPTVAVRQSNLATVYRALGDHARARDLLEEALRNDLENFGEKHPNVAVSQSNLANVYQDLGDHARARDLLEEALRNDLENFGEKHLKVAVRYNNLAWVERNEGNYRAAAAHFQKALEIRLQVFGESHPDVKTVRESLAGTLRAGAAAGDAEMQAMLGRLEAGELAF